MRTGKKIAAAALAAILIPVFSVLTAASAIADPGQSQPSIAASGVSSRELPAPTAPSLSRPSFIISQPKPIPPFPILLNQLVQHYVAQYLNHPRVLEASFERSRRYLPEMMQVMRAAGVPDDLVYLAFAESGFTHRGKGPWQFTIATARRFGLHVNHWVDERRDPIMSTRAAAEYLASLHNSAGDDWRLALVGWNGGDLAIDRYWELRGHNFNRFMKLLPRPTRSLLGRFMAVAFIAENAAAYGIGNVNYNAPLSYREIPVRGGLRLTTLAHRFHTTVWNLRELNPAILRDRVPPYARNYRVRVPLKHSSVAARADSFTGAGSTL